MDVSCHREYRLCFGWHFHYRNQTREMGHRSFIGCILWILSSERNQTAFEGIMPNTRQDQGTPGTLFTCLLTVILLLAFLYAKNSLLDLPDLLQHVIVRGVDRCDIFHDDQDRRRFVNSLSKLLVQTGTECLAWSLMTNHLHILLRPRRTRLAPFMRRLLTGYAIYYNLRHKN